MLSAPTSEGRAGRRGRPAESAKPLYLSSHCARPRSFPVTVFMQVLSSSALTALSFSVSLSFSVYLTVFHVSHERDRVLLSPRIAAIQEPPLSVHLCSTYLGARLHPAFFLPCCSAATANRSAFIKQSFQIIRQWTKIRPQPRFHLVLRVGSAGLPYRKRSFGRGVSPVHKAEQEAPEGLVY